MTNPSPECDHRSTEKGGWQEGISLLRKVQGYAQANTDAARTEDDQDTWRAHWRNVTRAVELLSAVAAAQPRSAPEPAPQVREALADELQAYFERGYFGPKSENLRARVLAALRALTPVVAREPVRWPNGCNNTVPRALRYLAEHPRPAAGQQIFNSEHLHQLAAEIEQMASRPLYTSPPPASAVREATIEECAKIADVNFALQFTKPEKREAARKVSSQIAEHIRALSQGRTDLKQADETSEKSR